MAYEFQSTLYRTQWEMHQAIAEAYMNAGGINDEKTIACFFTEYTDKELADEAIKGWELEDREDFDRAELIKAPDEMRSRLSC
jgi:hypothetical protein